MKESNDRALLKNLGVWLGLLTFAKNKPVLSRELELKQVGGWRWGKREGRWGGRGGASRPAHLCCENEPVLSRELEL